MAGAVFDLALDPDPRHQRATPALGRCGINSLIDDGARALCTTHQVACRNQQGEGLHLCGQRAGILRATARDRALRLW